ncbi:hypothetical protein GGX14DRAFT_648107 [Mycena pura]|uniref:Uncharacterized protein n=1 Tax=Mycena pura TaxID=153505 RepID=A0AAD6V632_9AGAR|nr:hypothetical protein GGX14DRAFT_648107 [Mycena pura]
MWSTNDMSDITSSRACPTQPMRVRQTATNDLTLTNTRAHPYSNQQQATGTGPAGDGTSGQRAASRYKRLNKRPVDDEQRDLAGQVGGGAWARQVAAASGRISTRRASAAAGRAGWRRTVAGQASSSWQTARGTRRVAGGERRVVEQVGCHGAAAGGGRHDSAISSSGTHRGPSTYATFSFVSALRYRAKTFALPALYLCRKQLKLNLLSASGSVPDASYLRAVRITHGHISLGKGARVVARPHC